MKPNKAILVTCVLYLVALALPAIDLFKGTLRGWEAAVVGMIAPPGWANVAGLVAIVGLGRRRFHLAYWAALIAVSLALLPIPFSFFEVQFPLHFGYFVWLASQLVLLHASWRARKETMELATV